jgi:hypothetical protein
MSIFAKGLVAAMEEEAMAAEDTELAIDEAGADSAEADLVEATDISADVEAGVQEVDQAMADAETLERIAGTAEEANADGGLDPVAAEIAEVAVEAIYSRLGISIAKTNYPALESFSGRSSRGRATSLAVESIREKIGDIWKAVKAAFARLVDFVKNVYQKLTDANRKYHARANALLAQVNAAKEEPSGKVKAKGILKGALAKDKAEVLANVGSAAEQVESYNVALTDVLAGAKEIVETVKDKKYANDELRSAALPKALAKGIDSLRAKTGPDKGAIHGKIQVTMGEDAPGTWDSIKGFAVSVKESVVSDAPELEALSLAEIKTVVKGVKDILEVSAKQKAAIASFDAVTKSIDEIIRAVPEAGKGGDERKTKDNAIVARNAVSKLGSQSVSLYTKVGKIAIDIAAAGLEYCERSLKAKEESKEEAK